MTEAKQPEALRRIEGYIERRNRARLAIERNRRRGTSATWLSGLVPLERRNHPQART